jgi:group I intron endonuclease
MSNFYIYIVHNIVNNKVYVGQTTNLRKRWNHHRSTASSITKKKWPLHRAIVKYGIESFVFTLIQEVQNKDELDLAEQYWIKHFNSRDRNYGYNLTDGGNGPSGAKRSEETKQKMRISKLGKKRSAEDRQKMSDGRRGIPLSTTHKQSMSKSRQNKYNGEDNNFYGKHHSDKSKEKIGKLKIEDVISIRKEYQLGNVTKQELAIKYNVLVDSIANVISKRTWKDI